MKRYEYTSINEKLYTHTLDNGLEINMIPKKGFNKKYALLTTKYGSLDNVFSPDGSDNMIEVPKGIAHFLEHKLFEKQTGDITKEFTKLGAHVNAYTTYERTTYLFTTTNHFETALETLLDFVQTPYFTKELIEKEQGIIAQEIAMYEDHPNYRQYMELLDLLYQNHPIKDDIVGTHESVHNITKEDLDTCYNTFYHPGNMMLLLLGDFDESEILSLIEENQSKKAFDAFTPIKRETIIEPKTINKPTSKLKMDVMIPQVMVGLKLDLNDLSDQERMIHHILLDIIIDMKFSLASNNYESLLEKQLINDSFQADVSIGTSYAFIDISGESLQPTNLIEEIKSMVKEINQTPFDEEEFELAKRNLIGNSFYAMNSLENMASFFLKTYYLNQNFFETIQLVESITFDQLQHIQKHFDINALSHVILYPNNQDE